jgi:molybdopterin molybdotransferase
MQRNLTVAEAQDCILAAVLPLPPETVAVAEADGRVLAETVLSSRLLPPADCSAMDGYAVHSAAVRDASASAPTVLPVAFEVAAGGVADCPLEQTEAARIFTGAPVPPGADAVIMQEHVEVEGEFIRIAAPVPSGNHIRLAGEDLQIGDRVLTAGSEVRPTTIGLLASLGRSVISVIRRPRVAILSSGDELVEPDGDIDGGRIVSSNSYTLRALCREVGADPIYLGISRDRPEDLEAHIRAGLSADCIVTSAGVSVGDHDHVKHVLAKLGCEIYFWGVQMKPGHPMVFGRFPAGGPFMFGLPGNPVSAAVTFEQFVRPALRRLLGFKNCFRPTLRARLRTPLHKRPGRLTFVRVGLERVDGEIWASSTGNQSSGVFRSMIEAQGLLVFPGPESELAEGDSVTVQIVDPGFFFGSERGFEGH